MQSMANKYLLLTLLWALLYPLSGYADEQQSHKDIVKTAQIHIENLLPTNVEKDITISPLDSRLKLHKCDQELEAFIPIGSKPIGKTTIGVRCSGKKPWKLFVTANISIYSSVIIATEYIARGESIRSDNIMAVKRETSTISRGYFEEKEQLIGKVAKYALIKDQIINPTAVSKPRLVKRGNEVVILARTGEIVVRMHGKAISDGTLGDIIQVKNTRSQRVIQARVISTNRVQVTM